MGNQNKNWILGRPLVHGDLEQIAEIARINKEKESKKNILNHGLDLAFIDIEVEYVSRFNFKCFKCDCTVEVELEGIDLNAEDYNDIIGTCHNCHSRYEIINNNNIVLFKD